MGQYNLFRKISQSSLTEKERTVDLIKNDILNDFQRSPSFYEVYIGDILREVQIITDRKNNKKILSKPNESFNLGDVVTWNGNKFLVIDIDEDNQIQTKGVIQLCNNYLNFYDQNHILYQIPCIIGNNISTSLEETKYMIENDDNITIRIPNNDITSSININDIYKIGRWNYKVISLSDIVEPGLLVLKMEFVTENQEEHVYTLEILNGNNLQIAQSQSLTLNVEVRDNGEIISTPPLSYYSSDENIATIDSSGVVSILTTGTVIFTATMSSDEIVNDSITVEIIADEQNNFTYVFTPSMLPKDEIIIGQTKDYNVQQYNNGDPIDQTFTFSIIGDPTSYKFTVIDGNNCRIEALKSGYTITLKAVDNNNTANVAEQVIALKNLF